jgi:hypothetical protein
VPITPESLRLDAAEAEARRVAEQTGDPEAALARFREIASPSAPATTQSARNPLLKPGDPTPAEWASLSERERLVLERRDPEASNRVLDTFLDDQRQAERAGDRRSQREAERQVVHAEIADDPVLTEAYIRARDKERFARDRHKMTPTERAAKARDLGIDLEGESE